jgi:NADPH:quinone reductase-like Zn-dependent oxidoreductase
MRAYALVSPDLAPQFTDQPMPLVAADEVLVRVHNSSVNPHDALVASGAARRYLTYVYPVVLGSDLYGTVEEVGHEVSDLHPGDRVLGLVSGKVAARGTFAELVAIRRDWVTRVPEQVDDVSAGALGLAALTALRCLEAVKPAEGDVVLVNGASGGVGSYLVQMLATARVEVLASAGTDDKATFVTSLGATHAIRYHQGGIEGQIRALHPGGVSAVVDLVTADRSALEAFAGRVLHPAGRIVSTRHAADPVGDRDATNVAAQLDRAALELLAQLLGGGGIRAAVSAVYPLAEIGDAFAELGRGARGKLAIQVGVKP